MTPFVPFKDLLNTTATMIDTRSIAENSTTVAIIVEKINSLNKKALKMLITNWIIALIATE